MRNTGIVYKWTNITNNKWYIGSHQGTAEDGYLASGKLIKRAFSKYGLGSFKREILYEGPDYKEQEEYHLKLHNAANDPQSYNLKNYSHGGGVKGQKRSEASRINLSRSKLGEKNPMFGKTLSLDHRKKVSAGLRDTYKSGRRVPYNLGKDPWNKGKTQERVCCPKCGTVGGISVMKRHHFDRCKNL